MRRSYGLQRFRQRPPLLRQPQRLRRFKEVPRPEAIPLYGEESLAAALFRAALLPWAVAAPMGCGDFIV